MSDFSPEDGLVDKARSDGESSKFDRTTALSASPSRLETRFSPASRSRLRTSRITWERIVLRALASLIRLELKSSSWSINVNVGRSGGVMIVDLGPRKTNQHSK